MSFIVLYGVFSSSKRSGFSKIWGNGNHVEDLFKRSLFNRSCLFRSGPLRFSPHLSTASNVGKGNVRLVHRT